MTLRSLAFPVKVLFTCFLFTIGIGYLFAVVYLFLIDVEPHTKHGVSVVQAVIIKYYGQRGATKLEASLDGTMGGSLTPAQKKQVTDWIRKGASETDFASVRSIFLDHCAACHSKESGLSLRPLTTFEEVAPYSRVDMGESVKRLIRVSHIHLFGISFIFVLTGGIFVLSEMKAGWRALIVAIPFLAMWIDIGSWWFTKVEPVFAYTVIIGGVLMGLSLAAQILISLWEMWFSGGAERHWLWLCPSAMVGLAALILMVWGLSIWTSLIIALLLVCPVIILWGLIKTIHHPSELPLEPICKTRGMTLNWLAPFYDRWCPGIGLGLSFRRETLRHAALQPGERILDVGCGTGVLTRMASETVGLTGTVVGIDPAPKMIGVARKNAAQTESRAQFRPAAVEDLPFEDGSFDVVLSSLMLHHLPPDVKQTGVAEVYRVLKPGGRFVVADFDWSRANRFYRFLGWPLRMIPMLRDHAAGRLDPYFRRAGFQPVEVVGQWGGFVVFYLAHRPK